MTTPLTKDEFIARIKDAGFEPDLEHVLVTMVHDAPEVTDELIHAVADVAEMHNENLAISADVLLKEADILENLSLELEAVEEEHRADELEGIYADLIGEGSEPSQEPDDATQPTDQPSQPAKPASDDEMTQLQSYIDSLKETPAE